MCYSRHTSGSSYKVQKNLVWTNPENSNTEHFLRVTPPVKITKMDQSELRHQFDRLEAQSPRCSWGFPGELRWLMPSENMLSYFDVAFGLGSPKPQPQPERHSEERVKRFLDLFRIILTLQTFFVLKNQIKTVRQWKHFDSNMKSKVQHRWIIIIYLWHHREIYWPQNILRPITDPYGQILIKLMSRKKFNIPIKNINNRPENKNHKILL